MNDNLTEKQKLCRHPERSKPNREGLAWCLRCGLGLRPRPATLTARQRSKLEYSLNVLRELNALMGGAYGWRTLARAKRETELRAELRRVDRGEDLRQLVLFSLVAAFVVSCGSPFTVEFFSDDAATDRPDAGSVVGDGGLRGRDAADRGPDSTGAGGAAPATGGADGAGLVPTSGGAPGAGGREATGGAVHRDAGAVVREDSGGGVGGAGAPGCVKYLDAVFVCKPGELTYSPCPIPPPGCYRANGTAIVCCKGAP